MRWALILSAALSAAGSVAPAQAQTITDQDRADARCFVVLQTFKTVVKDNGKPLRVEDEEKLDLMSVYFIGKLRSRHSASTPIGAILTPEVIKETMLSFGERAGPCIAEGKQYDADWAAVISVIENAAEQLDVERAKQAVRE